MGQGNHRKWTPTTQAKELPPLIKNWTTRVNNILHKDPREEITSFLTCSGTIPPNLLHEYTYKPILPHIINEEIKLTKKLIQTAEKQTQYTSYHKNKETRERNFKMNKISRCIKSILGTGSNGRHYQLLHKYDKVLT
jgi:hypothetical protein